MSITRTILRTLWLAVAFLVSSVCALIVLSLLGAFWAGGELSRAAPDDPVLGVAGPIIGLALFVGAVAPSLTVLPALIAAIIGELIGIRSWIYYVLAGGAALAAIPLLARPDATDLPPLPSADYMVLFAAAGFAGGWLYWLMAGRRA